MSALAAWLLGALLTASAPTEVLIALPDRGAALSQPGSTPRGAYRRQAYGAGASAEQRLRVLASRHGLKPGASWRIEALGWHCWRLRLAEGADAGAVLQALQADPQVALAQPINQFEGQTGETSAPRYNDPYLPLQRPFHELGAAEAQRHSRGAGVRVAVIDSGIDAAHPDLQGRLQQTRDSVGDTHPVGPRGERHGTQVAGLIAAVANNAVGMVGLAPEAQLLPLRACWETAEGRARCDSFTLARALSRALGEGVDIINMSLSGPRDPLLERLTVEAQRRGALVVSALPPGAGDEGFPAVVPGVLAVRSRDDPRAAEPSALSAPGREVLTLSPGGGYDYASGSSLAAAQLSGSLALLRSLHPRLDATTARRWLQGGGASACEAMRQLRPQLDCKSTQLPR